MRLRQLSWVWWVIIIAAPILLAALLIFDPHDASPLPPCPVHHLTGLHCPGCGATRAVYYLMRGDLLAAFGRNPLLVASLPLLLVLLIRPQLTKPRWVPWAALSVLVIFTALRNLPMEPFSHLAP